VVKGSDLRGGKSRSCGSLQKEVSVSPRPSFPVRWHQFVCANGLPIALQGSYEVAVAELLDRKGQHFTPHPMPGHRWVDEHGKVRHYYPDFHVTAINTFVDAKNMWVLKKDREKLQRVAAQIHRTATSSRMVTF
jgi:hypothetical protein